MKVSIIIPVYNVAPYIKRCLESVFSQDYAEIECILVDDCGHDNSIEIAEQLIRQYNGPIHFDIIHQTQNQGVSAARNRGIDFASGEYVFFLDADDAITPDCISFLVHLAEKYPDVDIVQGNTVIGSGCLVTHKYHAQVSEYVCDKKELNKVMLSEVITTCWGKLVRRSLIVKERVYFPKDISIAEDLYWTYFLTQKTKAAAFANRGLYFYYKNDNSATTSKKRKSIRKHLHGLSVTANAIHADIAQTTATDKSQLQFLLNILVSYMSCLTYTLSPKKWWRFWRLAIKTISIVSPKGLQVKLFFCMMPPLCFLSNISGWRWRIQEHIISKCRLHHIPI